MNDCECRWISFSPDMVSIVSGRRGALRERDRHHRLGALRTSGARHPRQFDRDDKRLHLEDYIVLAQLDERMKSAT